MKKLLALTLALLMMLACFASCAPKTPDEIRVYTLNGTTGFGMAKMIADHKDDATMKFEVKTDAADVTAALIAGTVDIAALPTNAAANVYNKTEGGVKILAVNTLGCLYLLTKEGTTVSTFADLAGKTVYAPAQNPTFIFTDLCKQNGLVPGTDITIDSTTYAKPEALKEAVASGAVDVAVLPEPMVTVATSAAKKNNITWKVALDLTAEWDKVHDAGSLVQGCIVVRTEWAKAHAKELAEFLRDYRASIKFTNDEPESAAAYIVSTGVFAGKEAVAAKAIPNCNIVYIDGDEMAENLSIFFEKLYSVNPNAVGGKIPDENIYYGKK